MAWSRGGDALMWLLVTLFIRSAASTVSNTSDDSVRWVTSDFGACSADCGGGVQVRTVQCGRTEYLLGDVESYTEVSENLCPVPPPHVTQTCNNHTCTGKWVTGEWSECSEKCGVGTQTRDVMCVDPLLDNQSYQGAHKLCPENAPETSRDCKTTDCPEDDYYESHSILTENYTLIQVHRTKIIRATIGGQVYILPRQTVIVTCPVKKFSENLVYWRKSYRFVPLMGRVRSTSDGLHIDKANPSFDAGTYTCFAGDLSATVSIHFISKNDSLVKKYKKWIRKSMQKQENNYVIYKHETSGNEKHILKNTGLEEPNHQRDEGQNSTSVLMYITQAWSPCNATCTVEGHQYRNVTCSAVTQNYVKIVPDSECMYAGLEMPEARRGCQVKRNTCALWRTGPWSQCRGRCHIAGRMTRLLTCVWELTGQPAWTACDVRTKPLTQKPCKTRPCSSACTDNSRYCSLAKFLKLCRYPNFQQDCCQTCQILSTVVTDTTPSTTVWYPFILN